MPTSLIAEEIARGLGLYLSQGARLFPSYRQGRPVTISCLVRWIMDGVTGHDGSRIRLEAARLAGKWVTTPGAIARFINAQTPDPTIKLGTGRSPLQRQRAAERAAAQLAKDGY